MSSSAEQAAGSVPETPPPAAGDATAQKPRQEKPRPEKQKQEKGQQAKGKDAGQQQKGAKQQQQQQHNKGEGGKGGGSNAPQKQGQKAEQQAKSNQSANKGNQDSMTESDSNRIKFFDHLISKSTLDESLRIEGKDELHPATVKLGAMFRTGVIRDDDDRVVAMLALFRYLVKDYTTPPNKTLSWDFNEYTSTQLNYLSSCRQLSLGMTNLATDFSYMVSNMHEAADSEAKEKLLDILNIFVEQRILLARKGICKCLASSIRDGDTVMTFGGSSVVRQALLAASKEKSFRVIIIDSRPLNDGVETLKELSSSVKCTYMPLSGCSQAIKETSKVLLGASGVLSNGRLVGPAGSAMVAAYAKASSVPVMVAAESYKFCEQVQLDAIVKNELGNPSEVAVSGSITEAVKDTPAGPEAIPQTATGFMQSEATPSAQLPFQVIMSHV
jgi:translation initiation factor eIF-2B subunit delta